MKILISGRRNTGTLGFCVANVNCGKNSCNGFGSPCYNNCTSYCGNYMSCNPKKPGNAQTGINIRERK